MQPLLADACEPPSRRVGLPGLPLSAMTQFPQRLSNASSASTENTLQLLCRILQIELFQQRLGGFKLFPGLCEMENGFLAILLLLQ